MDDLLARVGRLPCGRRLLEAAAGQAGVHLVGGAVRDLLLGREPRELDVVVEGDVAPLARRLGAGATVHERFGTATVQSGGCRFDLAAARAETYARPGALPDVRPADIDADLRRRDVTVNALALDLAGGELRAVEHAREDLDAGRLRVLHDASFTARYAARLGFDLEERTAALAAAAVAAGALDTVSGDRIGNELRLALAEPDPLAALAAAAALGLAPWLAPGRERAEAALALLPPGEGRADMLVLAASLAREPGSAPEQSDALLARLGFTAAERAVLRACARASDLAAAMTNAGGRASALARLLRGVPVEAVALAGAHGASEAARRWLGELRHDLLAAGVPLGPEVGTRLAAALDRRLDGELAAGREAELAAALEAPADS
jgi:tRNA nucleotidyltransferase (CCA-adding enzyme)